MEDIRKYLKTKIFIKGGRGTFTSGKIYDDKIEWVASLIKGYIDSKKRTKQE